MPSVRRRVKLCVSLYVYMVHLGLLEGTCARGSEDVVTG